MQSPEIQKKVHGQQQSVQFLHKRQDDEQTYIYAASLDHTQSISFLKRGTY